MVGSRTFPFKDQPGASIGCPPAIPRAPGEGGEKSELSMVGGQETRILRGVTNSPDPIVSGRHRHRNER